MSTCDFDSSPAIGLYEWRSKKHGGMVESLLCWGCARARVGRQAFRRLDKGPLVEGEPGG